MHRAAGLYYTETRYEELAQAVGGGVDQPSSSLSQPASVDLDDEMVVRLTWMIHDVSVWRIDGIYITQSDGIWISTLIDQGAAMAISAIGPAAGIVLRTMRRCWQCSEAQAS